VQPAVWRRLWLGLALAVALDLGLCGAGATVGGYELLAAQHQLGGADPSRLAVEGPTLRTRLGTAAAAFALARFCWWPWHPLASVVAAAGGPARVVGAVGPLLDLADDGSVAGAHTLDGALPVLAALHQGHGPGDAGARLLDGLRRSSSALRAALFDIRQAEADRAALDARALPAALRARLVPLAGRLPAADEALRVALAAPSVLGATRPRDYLLVPENPWDLRATGGFAGTVALLHAWHGRLTLSASQASDTVGARRPGYVPPPLPLLVYQHLSNWYYRDANWSPDFPTSAALLRYFYWLGEGRLPDGVVAFDTYLLGPLLQITGPVRVPGTSITLTAQHGVHMLDYYVNYAGVGGHAGIVNKQFANAAYRAVFARLRALPAASLSAAAHALDAALRQRHLLLWLPDPAMGPILARHGWDGAIDPTGADYLYVVDTNVHYNKINELVRERIAYRAAVEPDRSLRSTVVIAYTNTATPANLPKPQNNTLYEDFVRVYVPLGSRLLHTSGLTQPWPATRAHNKTVFSGYLRVPSRARATVTFTYTVPPNALLDPVTYHLTIQKQPGTDAIPVFVQVRAGAPGIRVGGGSAWSWQGLLRTDMPLTASLAGGHARPVPLVYDAGARVPITPGAAIEPWVVLPATLPRPR
jgi:hypothetical protein